MRLRRIYKHRQIESVCAAITSGSGKPPFPLQFQEILGRNQPILDIASAFPDLMSQRHAETFNRAATNTLVEHASKTVATLREVRSKQAGKCFLMSLNIACLSGKPDQE
jgi:hypothetical protein